MQIPPEGEGRPSEVLGTSALPAKRLDVAVSLGFWGMLGACVLWILSLPLFPSQDGPMHMYYVQILGKLLHHSTEYAGFLTIRSLLSVYSLHYYLLLVLHTVFSWVQADKLVVCIIVILFACGFRVLARSLGPMGSLASLFIFPVILSWPLGMGFYNFCLSAGLGMFALAVWFRSARSATWSNSFVFLALLALMTVSHPVPLLLVLALAGIELLLRVTLGNSHGFILRLKNQIVSIMTLVLGCSTLLFVLHFTDTKRVASNVAATHSSVAARLHQLGLLRTFGLYAGGGVLVSVYRLALYLVLIGALGFATLAWFRRSGDRRRLALWVGVAVLLFIGLPLIPEKMNGSAFFADRLVMFLWVAALAAFSCIEEISGHQVRILASVSVAILLLTLGEGEAFIRPVAVQVAQIETAPLPEPTTRQGVGSITSDPPVAPRLTFNPYIWHMARYFRREDAVMLNAPWLDLPILPLAAGPELLTRELPQAMLDQPDNLPVHLQQIAKVRADRHELPIGFVLFMHRQHEPEKTTAIPPALRVIPGDLWKCHDDTFLLLCNAARP